MSRKMLVLSLAALLVAGASTAGELAWFDMVNCSMCKNIMKHDGLMQSITWEQHPITNGVVSVTTVDPKHIDSYRSCHADMEMVGQKMGQGETMPLCGSCTALNNAIMHGVGMEYVKTSTGDVWLLTSDKPELVAEIQGWAKRNDEEKAKMKKM